MGVPPMESKKFRGDFASDFTNDWMVLDYPFSDQNRSAISLRSECGRRLNA
jgi:hypothetical protein